MLFGVFLCVQNNALPKKNYYHKMFSEPVSLCYLHLRTEGHYTLFFKHESRTFVVQHRGVEQLVARWAHNPKATGSSPVPATTNPRHNSLGFFIFRKYASAI
jgi:hypothetical protein